MLAERKQLARDLDDDARFAEMRMEGLPASPAAAVTELADYEWRSSDAREKYDQIKDLLGRELLDQRFAGMKQALENATPEDRERVEEMLRDLGDLLAAHARGDDTTEQFRDFMDQHGEFFPENPENVDELIDSLAERAAAAQRMLASMTPEQRAELAELSQQAFGSPGLMDQLDRLDDLLRGLRPGEDWDGSEQFGGQQGLGLGDGTGVLQDIAQLDALSDQLAQAHPGARMDDVDLDALARQLGDEAAVDARALAALEKALRESGYLTRAADGTLRLSPQAMRELGQLAAARRGRVGCRTGRARATCGPPARPVSRAAPPAQWEFGDTEAWDVTRTMTNALTRTADEGTGRARRHPARHPRRRGGRDRGAHPGRGGAARRHVVLDGDGRPVGADEAHRARAAPAHLVPLPRRLTSS